MTFKSILSHYDDDWGIHFTSETEYNLHVYHELFKKIDNIDRNQIVRVLGKLWGVVCMFLQWMSQGRPLSYATMGTTSLMEGECSGNFCETGKCVPGWVLMSLLTFLATICIQLFLKIKKERRK